MLIRAFDHVRFPDSISPDACLELSFGRISREALGNSSRGVSIMDAFVNSQSVSGVPLLSCNVQCIEITNDTQWWTGRTPALNINTKYDFGSCTYALVGVVFAGNMGFASAVVLDRSVASDDGVCISPAVYYYNPKDGRAIRTQHLQILLEQRTPIC